MIDTIIELVARIDLVLYFLCGLGFLVGLRGWATSRRLRREAVFGLEREAARAIRRRALNMLGSVIALAGAVYVVTNVVRPAMQEMPSPEGGGPAGTPEALATPEMTGTPRPLLFPTVTPTFGIVSPEEDAPAEASASEGEPAGCEIIGATIANPLPGEVVAGQVEVFGEANILNFDSYKFEISGPSTGGAWATLSTFTTPVANGSLGTWDATSLDPGSYRFRLVVVDTSGTFPTPCEIPLTIASPAIQPGPTVTPG
jgi:hypothetical protein